MQIADSLALVTGGAKGLGRVIAAALAEAGAQVEVVDLDEQALGTLPEGWGRRAVDVRRPAEVKAAVAEIVDARGRIDVLVNNAGVISSEPFVNIMNPAGMMHDYERFKAALEVNLDSVFIVTSAVVEQMVRSRTKGSIVNISSISACGNEGQTAYSAAKAAVNAMTVTWSKELGRFGIRCNAVAPGFIDTDSTRAALDESVIKHIVGNTALRRLGAAEEVAGAVKSLVENDFVTGAILAVDGGLRI